MSNSRKQRDSVYILGIPFRDSVYFLGIPYRDSLERYIISNFFAVFIIIDIISILKTDAISEQNIVSMSHLSSGGGFFLCCPSWLLGGKKQLSNVREEQNNGAEMIFSDGMNAWNWDDIIHTT